MLIRSQDKKSLYNLDSNKGLWITARSKGTTIVAEGLGDMGHYSTEAKAIKVLDMICDAYELCDCTDYQNIGYVGNKVYQMPSDEEVEGQE